MVSFNDQIDNDDDDDGPGEYDRAGVHDPDL